jgi:tetratricopeptide (TPR) repeat protein
MIPAELRTAIKENNLVLFVGAGLSCKFENKNGVKIGNWKNLVIKIIEHLENDETKVKNLKPLADSYNPIDMLYLIEKIGNGIRNKALEFSKDFFTLKEDNNNFELHKRLCQITQKIITTNYDNAFEIAEKEFDSDRTITRYNEFGFKYLNKPNELALLKLHGCRKNPDTMVLFPSDYDYLYNQRNAVNDDEKDEKKKNMTQMFFCLQNLVFNKTVLFIGCGMGEFQINKFFLTVKDLSGKYNNKKHFVISKEKPDSSLNFLEHIKIDNYSEIETIIDELLEIKFVYKKQAEEFKKQKEEAEKKMEILKQELAETDDKIKYFELCSLKYFNKGIDFHKKNEYEKAIEQYEIAIEFNPVNNFISDNLKTATYDLFKQKEDDENFIRENFEKYEKATIFNPRDDSAFDNWGTALLVLYAKKNDKILLDKALYVCTEAYKINKVNSYNLACCYSRLKEKENALQYLKESMDNKVESIEYVLADEDWEFYLDDEDFKKLIKKYR